MEKPKPKPRKIDQTFYTAVRERDGVCLWGLKAQDGCSGSTEVHHIIPRSLGGPDEVRNGILLCRRHHQMTEAQTLPAPVLADLLIDYYHYTYPAQEIAIIWHGTAQRS